mmetsp:Transcript_4210/g.12245  ORF Transcript_4210/g.12245 Transcript_4210/m.12245 type:complete len:355 (+) Transcript_4210:1473-2537(+)
MSEFTVGMSMPFSTTVVAMRMSAPPSANLFTMSCRSLRRPCATRVRALGRTRPIKLCTSSMSLMRGTTKMVWPPRCISWFTTICTSVSLKTLTAVVISLRSGGGVRMVDMSRMPARPICSVRGMGVADNVSTSKPSVMPLRRSLCATPKRCSSSMTSSLRLLNSFLPERMACVPMTTSTVPLRMPSRIAAASLGRMRLVSSCTLTPSGMRARMVLRCCDASTVVGASTALWRPQRAARYRARIATSVLPKPTSPQTRRSMGCCRQTMSTSMSRKHLAWSGVGLCSKASPKAFISAPSRPQGSRLRPWRSAYRPTTSAASSSVLAVTFSSFFFQRRSSLTEPSGTRRVSSSDAER